MVARKFEGRYLLAAFITIIIFVLGMLLGMVIEEKRARYLTSIAEEQKLSLGSLQLQYQFISQLGEEKSCPAVTATFKRYMDTLVKTQERLENYEKDSKVNKDVFRLLKQEYTQAQLNFWLLAKKTRALCEKDVVSILYFYSSGENCPDCEEQAFVLSYLKQLLKDRLLVFSIDESLDIEPMVSILKNTFNITKYPTVIVEKEKIENLAAKEIILKRICKYYKTKIDECLPYYDSKNASGA